jgi:hypothetical protein
VKALVRSLTLTALTSACAFSLVGPVQAATASPATAPAQRFPALQDEGDPGFASTNMQFEEFGKKGAYDHARQWDEGTGGQ